ncbi:hypothetical protein RCL1_005659 [Eukaryota sp. TZLM3-RCL]
MPVANSLDLAHRSLTSLNNVQNLLKKSVTVLDLSHNSLTDLALLCNTPNLATLVCNNNKLTDLSCIPTLHSLRTLWLAKNEIRNIHRLLSILEQSCPYLTDLLLLGNECCPSYLNDHTKREYTDYRLFVLGRLPTLKVLDCTPVSDDERLAAIKYSCYSTNQRPRRPSVMTTTPLVSHSRREPPEIQTPVRPTPTTPNIRMR